MGDTGQYPIQLIRIQPVKLRRHAFERDFHLRELIDALHCTVPLSDVARRNNRKLSPGCHDLDEHQYTRRNNMKRKVIAGLMIAAMAMVSFAGCGGEEGSVSSSTSAGTSAAVSEVSSGASREHEQINYSDRKSVV